MPKDLRDRLLAAVHRLEDIPDEQKDWHPGSNKQVLDLVHPSLYPIVNKRTLNTAGEHPLWPSPNGATEYLSKRFQWLPSDFAIDSNGKAHLSSSYINNILGTAAANLYPVIDELVTLAVPMWERVLSDLRRPLSNIRMKVIDNVDEYRDYQGRVGCIWRNEHGRCDYQPYPDDSDSDDWDQEKWDAYFATQPQKLPEALDAYTGALDIVKKTVSLNNSTIQVIVKLANIVLTPENPKYAGGKWHVEGVFYSDFGPVAADVWTGMLNESIVSTFIYVRQCALDL